MPALKATARVRAARPLRMKPMRHEEIGEMQDRHQGVAKDAFARPARQPGEIEEAGGD